MKFSQAAYQRPDLEACKELLRGQIETLNEAQDFVQADAAFLKEQKLIMHITTMNTLAHIRHDIDTNDEFYANEVKWQAQAGPSFEEVRQQWTQALLKSRFRKAFEKKYGSIFFVNQELENKSFAPAILEELQEETILSLAYSDLIASAQIEYDGKIYTLSQLSPFKQDPNDVRRRSAWESEGRWYRSKGAELDDIYDKLVHVRTRMAKKLGYKNYIPLGYLRMQRNCYDQRDIETFRASVRRDLVPVASEVVSRQAQRLGKNYPLTFDEEALFFRSGNARPIGTPDEILAAGRKFYHELSPETAEFIDFMLDNEMMDVLSRTGKAGGGYCETLPTLHSPFIFANFNGTQHDVEVITHEAGHAFEAYTARNILPIENIWPSMESCEIHSMSMEFFAEPWAENFFGAAADKFRYKHLCDALTFIPYGTMVDHFQHVIYENPDFTPEQRHETWRELLSVYMPWIRCDTLPFYGDGHGWQRQQHIFRSPFYYIDYCLAESVALQFWKLMQTNRAEAWKRYMALVRPAGTLTFTELIAKAGLISPFVPGALKDTAETARRWLNDFDEEKIL